MKNAYFLRVVWMVFVSVFIVACNRSQQIPSFDPAFEPYIEAFTSGTIASDAPIVVKLAFEVDTAKVKNLRASDLLKSKPRISGTLAWTDARTLVFRPNKTFSEGKIYLFELQLNKLIDIPKPLHHFRFGVKILEQGFQLYNWTLQATSGQGGTRWNVVGEVRAANPVTLRDTRDLIEVLLNEKTLGLNWTLKGSKELEFVSDTFSLPYYGNPVKIRLKSSKTFIPYYLSDTLSWNGKGLEPVMWRMFFGEENYLWIAFSEPLDPQQNPEGLVLLDGQAPRRFLIRDNQMFCYFDADFTGGEKLEVFPGIRDLKGQVLSEPIVKLMKGIYHMPELRWLREGTILPLAGEVNLPFAAVGLKKVDVRVIRILQSNIKFFLQYQNINGRDELRRVGKVVARTTLDLSQSSNADPSRWEIYYLNLSNLVKAEPGAIYRVTLSMKPEYSTYPCASAGLSGKELSYVHDSDDEDGYYEEDDDYYDYYTPKGWRWEQRDNPCHVSYYSGQRWISTNLLATNIALTAKVGTDGVVSVWAADIIKGKPLHGIDIEVYDFQMVLLNKGKTGAGGLAALSVKDNPLLVIASRENEKSYLRINEGSELSVSSFEVDGAPVQKGLRGYIYGERGVWRPGDTLHLWFILDKRRGNLPDEYPVVLELKNPQGQVVHRQVSTQGIDGIYAFKYATWPQAPTGKWTAQVKAGQAVFSKVLNIETVEPNRLKIRLQVKPPTPPDPENVMLLSASWLHGAPASNLQVQVEATFRAGKLAAEGFRGFIFEDEARDFREEKREIFSGNLDAEGNVTFKYGLTLENAPGPVNVVFTTRVFEPGGAFSIDQTETILYPYERYAGFRLPQLNNDWESYSSQKPLPIELALVDKNGKPVVGERVVSLSLYHLEWRWWVGWGQRRGTYLDNELTDPVVKATVRLNTGRGHYELPTRDLAGRFLLIVFDPETRQKSSKVIYIGNFWDEGTSYARGMILLKPTQKKIKAGEKASITIPSVPGAQILVSLESGGTLLDYKWIASEGERTVLTFSTTPEMVPGVYVYASVIQPWQYPNDLPIRMYGISYVEIENPEAKLNPVIKIASQLRSGQKAQIRISEARGRPMAYTLAIVDEGLLDLTRFATPDPYSSFFAKEALAIRTWDSYNEIISSFTTRMDRSFLVGGDEYRRPHDNLLARRFKPLVIALGPYRLEKGKTRLHNVYIPEFVGSARVMVVAAGEGAYGSADKTIKIIQPLIVLGSIPRVLGPGEEVRVAATVWKYDASIKDASVKLELKGDLSLIDSQEQRVSFKGRESEKTVWFRVKTGRTTGVCHFRFTAQSGNGKSVWESDIDLRNPNPVITEVKDYVVEAGKKVEIRIPETTGEKGTTVLEVSSFPSTSLMRRTTELLQYPYGCAEQTTSALFPQLLLSKFTQLDSLQLKKRNRNLREGVQKLVSMQAAGGGISFWPGIPAADEWVSSWVGHFMLEARKQGFVVPAAFFDAWLAYQRRMAQQWRYAGYDALATIQAYRLFTLALAGKSDLGAMNRLRSSKELQAEASLLLAQAYFLAGYRDVATQLVNASNTATPIVSGPDLTLGSELRQQALRLYVLSQLKMNQEEAYRLARSIATALSGPDALSTQSTAWALLALQSYLEGRKQDSQPEFILKAGGKTSVIKLEASVWTYYLPDRQTSLTLENKSRGALYASLTRSYRPMPGEKVQERSNGLALRVSYITGAREPFDPLRIRQGADFIIKARVSNTSGRMLQHAALNLMLAPGWQILNTRFMTEEGEPAQRNYIWQDIRDDRIYTFFTLGAGETKEFSFRINASYAGRFFMPAVLAEDMYHPEVSALVPGFFTEVYVP